MNWIYFGTFHPMPLLSTSSSHGTSRSISSSFKLDPVFFITSLLRSPPSLMWKHERTVSSRQNISCRLILLMMETSFFSYLRTPDFIVSYVVGTATSDIGVPSSLHSFMILN